MDHLISKTNCQALNSFKKQTNEFVSTSMQYIFICFLEEIEDSNKTFQNPLKSFKSSDSCSPCPLRLPILMVTSDALNFVVNTVLCLLPNLMHQMLCANPITVY